VKCGLGVTFKLDFEEVRVDRVSQYQLRNSLNKNAQECALVRPFLDAAYSSEVSSHKKAQRNRHRVASAEFPQTIVTDKLPPLVVGTLFSARRVIHVAITDKAAGDAEISFVEQLIKRLGLGSNFKASVGGGAYSNAMVDIRSENIVPVALKPAYVVTSSKKLAEGKTKYEIANIDQATIERKIRIARKNELDSLATAALRLKRLKMWAREEEAPPHTAPRKPFVSRETVFKDALRPPPHIVGAGF
jgi:hypothetical protein